MTRPLKGNVSYNHNTLDNTLVSVQLDITKRKYQTALNKIQSLREIIATIHNAQIEVDSTRERFW